MGSSHGSLVPPEQRPRLRGVSHHYAFYVSLVAGVAVVVTAPSARARLAAAVFACAVSAMLGVSALLHRGRWSYETAVRLLRLDHTTIFVCIAGTCTPIGLLALTGVVQKVVLGGVWCGALAGIAAEWTPWRPPRGVTTGIYLTLGWIAVLAFPWLWVRVGVGAVVLIVAGGAFYTVGAVIHGLRRPDPIPHVFGYHEIFHAFVIAAVTLHYCAIAFFIVPRG